MLPHARLLPPLIVTLSLLIISTATFGKRYRDFEYEIQGESATITGYSINAKGNFIIPNTIEGYPVREIGASAFEGRSIDEVAIPEGVVSIAESAFAFSELSRITLPSTLSSISEDAFYGAQSLGWIEIHSENEHFTVIDGKLYNKDVTKIILAPPSRNIPDPFEIPDSVTEIGAFAFAYTTFQEVCISESVTSIGERAFAWARVFDINIPAALTSIDSTTFFKCTYLRGIEVDEYNPNFVSIDGVLFTKNLSDLILYPANREGTSYAIPDGVVNITDLAFDASRQLETVSVPSTVQSIESQSFNFDATSIEVDAQNQSYKSVDGVLLTEDGTELVFFPPEKPENNYAVPDGVTKIGDRAFESCHNLSSVSLPDGLTHIGAGAFEDCRWMTAIQIPEGLLEIGECAFDRCRDLFEITIPDSVTSIGQRAFAGCRDLEVISIPDHLLVLEPYTFQGCRNLRSLVLPTNLMTIGQGALSSCRSLTSIVIPDTVNTIGASAFTGCVNLEKIELPEALRYIGDYAFFNCASFTEFNLPRNVEFFGEEVLTGSSNLEEITVAEENSYFKSMSGVLYTHDQKRLLKYPAANPATSFQIAEGTEEIATRAFRLSILEGISFPVGLKSIEALAFDECKHLQSIDLPDSIATIESNAFDQCIALHTVKLPNGITEIEDGVFGYCTSLKQVSVPESVLRIGDYAFNSCHALETISLGNQIDFIGNHAFEECFAIERFDVPPSVQQIGDRAFSRCGSLVEVLFSEELEVIGDHAFFECRSLIEVSFPESLFSIESSAFETCTSLTAINFSEGLVSIGREAFDSCWEISSVFFPSTVEKLRTGAFSFCINLKEIYFNGDAPLTDDEQIQENVFAEVNEEAIVYYFEDSSGFTSPTWAGLPTVNLGSRTGASGWLLENNLKPTLSLDSDPLNSGIPLLVNYSLGQKPGQLFSPVPRVANNSTTIRFYGDREDINYVIEISKDLQSWTSTGVPLSEPDLQGQRIAEILLEDRRCFVRLRFLTVP